MTTWYKRYKAARAEKALAKRNKPILEAVEKLAERIATTEGNLISIPNRGIDFLYLFLIIGEEKEKRGPMPSELMVFRDKISAAIENVAGSYPEAKKIKVEFMPGQYSVTEVYGISITIID